MNRKLFWMGAWAWMGILMVGGGPLSAGEARAAERPQVVMETTHGEIVVELFQEEAPITVNNFLMYVNEGFYDGVIFHRIIPGFVIQGGGLTPDLERKRTRAPIENEADNGLKNERGTLSMARTQAVDSATSQFFINLEHNVALDHGVRDFGYAVFARVVEGMDVVDAIAQVETGVRAGQPDVPLDPPVIERAYLR